MADGFQKTMVDTVRGARHYACSGSASRRRVLVDYLG